MPRRAFVADLQKAIQGVAIAGISEVEQGNDDGEFTFLCLADGQDLKISCLIPELSDYPSNHTCMIFAPDNAPANVAATLNDISERATGKSVMQILELVANKLESTDDDGDQQMVDSQALDDFDDDEDIDDDDDDYFPGDEDMLPRPVVTAILNSGARNSYHAEANPVTRARIRHDLLVAKANGFKVGYQGGLLEGLGCYVSLSIRFSKLGISEEAMKAWQLEPNEYLVAIFHYPNGYKSMDEINSYDPLQARRNFGIRVGVSDTYKPSLQEAVLAFTVLSKEEEMRKEASQTANSQQEATFPGGFRNSFISRPLNELLEQRFPFLLKYRYSGLPWHGAEAFHNAQISRSIHSSQAISEDKFYEPEEISTAYPRVVMADHITESTGNKHSLPLVGMQFVLRHFVRCTEFCLICFSKMQDDLQAIKPYVCDNPLCLYQYMSLGFGPSIEHEILSQPKVVDLLISFCYVSARTGRLQEFPSGLSLAVPSPLSNDQYKAGEMNINRFNIQQTPQPPQPPSKASREPVIEMRYNSDEGEMLFADKSQACPVNPGNWIVIRMEDAPDKALHCRVLDVSLFPSVRVSAAIEPTFINEPQHHNPHRASKPTVLPQKVKPGPAPKTRDFRPASFCIYNQNFDDLSDVEKRQAISALLDVLPPVAEMRQFLLRKAQSPLSAWSDRLSPALLGILRWIIASNRACIIQVDSEETAASGRKVEDKLYGMDGWTQFRFAMGAPDKERRFIQAVRSTSDRLQLKYPTLFAWHGSPLHNWHSIIREGLHYKDVHHGRAYGNGVYHATDVNTSLGYSGYGGAYTWSNSELRIQQALALNEIVNAPKEYVSSQPYLVVGQVDWIQTRYLFINTRQDANSGFTPIKSTKPLQYLEQDPSMTPRGVTGPLIIPIHAISGSRRPEPKSTGQHKRLKASGSSKYDPIEIEDDEGDTASITTDDEDRAIFEEEEGAIDDVMEAQPFDSIPTPNSFKIDKGKSKIGGFVSKLLGSKLVEPLTDYIPGTLDYSTLPMLEMPAWATTSATRRLMKDFKDMIHVQNTTPPHELGWHIDDDRIDNMYQWVVELHSFDSSLPLAQDMKKHGVKSVVLELRFGKDYPMSPPFVRVIRPRFLGFQQGGGGHVTAGGAMCMQLLTNDGWSAVSSIESVLLQVRMAISSTDPCPARLQMGGRPDYGVGEAVEAYMRACAVHGWTVPPGFREMAYGGHANGGSGAY